MVGHNLVRTGQLKLDPLELQTGCTILDMEEDVRQV
jgi:hypothetical protein